MISIIIPTFNASKTIEVVLESIRQQTYKNFEVVLIDNLSTDNTLEIVKQYENLIKINIISEKDTGIYDAMNKGIKMAKGEWVYFLGSDDKLFNETVLSTVATCFSNDTDIVYGNSVWMPENIEERGECDYHRILSYSVNHQRIFYRKALFEKYGFFNTSYKIAADHERNIHFFCEPQVKKKYIDTQIVYYFSGGYSADKIDEKFWNDWKKILLKNFKPYVLPKEIYERLAWYCWHNIHKKKYGKAFRLFGIIYFNTFSFQFLKHTLSQTKKRLQVIFKLKRLALLCMI